ncbi:MAG: response regulator transcription factor [Dehalococcoidia bacterium]|nr:response regulator transcription factor [Dehalococcoidia bacterium]
MRPAGEGGPLILVVEDDKALTRMIRLTLSTVGFRIITAAEGASALRAATAQQPDAILVDVRLPPGISGPELVGALKLQADVPVIVVSGDSRAETRIECTRRGADDFIEKPFNPDELERRLRFLLRHDESPSDPGDAMRLGDLSVDMERQAVFRDHAMLRLSVTDWTLLQTLTAHDGAAVLHRELLVQALGRRHALDTELLQACIERLRIRIDGAIGGSKIIDFHGVGYALGYPVVRPSRGGGK